MILKNQTDPEFNNILNTKTIVILPMANPSGYSKIRREEQQKNGNSIDMNRDFPYNQAPNKCFKTAGARVIHYLFKKYIF